MEQVEELARFDARELYKLRALLIELGVEFTELSGAFCEAPAWLIDLYRLCQGGKRQEVFFAAAQRALRDRIAQRALMTILYAADGPRDRRYAMEEFAYGGLIAPAE